LVPPSPKAAKISLSFLEYLCHEAVEEGAFDVQFIELQMEKFAMLTGGLNTDAAAKNLSETGEDSA